MDWNANSWCVAIKKKLLFGVGSDSSVNYFSSEVTSTLVTAKKNTTAIVAIISVSKKRAVINQLIRRKSNQTKWRNAN